MSLAPRWFLIPAALSLLATAHAQPSHTDAIVLIHQARGELNDLDELVDDADSRAVQKELHKKVQRINQLLIQLEAGAVNAPVAGNVDMQVNAPEAGMGVTMGSTGLSITVTETPGVGTAPPAPPPPPEDVGPVAASGDRFRSIHDAVDDESFSSSQLKVLSSAAADYWFTAQQARQLMEIFDFGKDQVEAGVILFPRVVDPENWYVVYDVFDFDSDKDKLRRRTGR